MTPAALTAELGGTWLRVRLERGDGLGPRRARLPAVAPDALPEALARLLRAWRAGRPARLLVGSKGVWSAPERRRLRARLSGLARRVSVVSDLELAHREIFGAGPGIVVVAGTGSAAFGRGPRGRAARAGGLGPLLGDEGSAFWLAREALKDARLSRRFPAGLALRLGHDRETVRRTAALSRRVLSWAAAGDAAALRLRRRAAAELAIQAREVARRVGAAEVSWRGGQFSDPGFRRDFARALAALRPPLTARPPGGRISP